MKKNVLVEALMKIISKPTTVSQEPQAFFKKNQVKEKTLSKEESSTEDNIMDTESLNNMTLKDLKNHCKDKGIKGYSGKKKDVIVNLILESQSKNKPVIKKKLEKPIKKPKKTKKKPDVENKIERPNSPDNEAVLENDEISDDDHSQIPDNSDYSEDDDDICKKSVIESDSSDDSDSGNEDYDHQYIEPNDSKRLPDILQEEVLYSDSD
jgi:hypothetical protein